MRAPGRCAAALHSRVVVTHTRFGMSAPSKWTLRRALRWLGIGLFVLLVVVPAVLLPLVVAVDVVDALPTISPR